MVSSSGFRVRVDGFKVQGWGYSGYIEVVQALGYFGGFEDFRAWYQVQGSSLVWMVSNLRACGIQAKEVVQALGAFWLLEDLRAWYEVQGSG